jgi:hypothetical protein
MFCPIADSEPAHTSPTSACPTCAVASDCSITGYSFACSRADAFGERNASLSRADIRLQLLRSIEPNPLDGTGSGAELFGAQQAAISACLSYNENKEPQPPLVSAGQAQSAVPGESASSGSSTQLSAASGLVANQAALASALRAGQQLPSTTTFFLPQQLQACSRCACD